MSGRGGSGSSTPLEVRGKRAEVTTPPDDLDAALDRAAAIVAGADALLVTAGAGMGVDSGLPDFRGDAGFWRAYPALGARGIDFVRAASPAAFDDDPRLAWGFYGHRLALYRATVPHAGFAGLLAIASRLRHGAFAFTSNVDGQFQKAGFAAERVCEVHGSIHHLQCLEPCGDRVWRADGFVPEVDEAQCRLVNELPRCAACDGLARPNVLMFGDAAWIGRRTAAQQRRLDAWLRDTGRVAVIELGAGTAIPTVRRRGERFLPHLVRINPRESRIDGGGGVSLPLGAREGVAALVERLLR